MSVYNNILDTIGNTPVVQLSRLDTGVSSLFLKLENQNPGGSIKDRTGLNMIVQAEKRGTIHPGDLIVEATAGNTRSQETIALSDGSAIRLSTKSFLTPSGVDISAAGGVVPDMIVFNSDASATGTTEGTTGGEDGTASISNDEQLMAALRLLS
jgi:hypothetical protein